LSVCATQAVNAFTTGLLASFAPFVNAALSKDSTLHFAAIAVPAEEGITPARAWALRQGRFEVEHRLQTCATRENLLHFFRAEQVIEQFHAVSLIGPAKIARKITSRS